MPLRCSFLQYAASSIVTFDCLLGFSGYRIATPPQSNDTTGGSHFEIDVNIYAPLDPISYLKATRKLSGAMRQFGRCCGYGSQAWGYPADDGFPAVRDVFGASYSTRYADFTSWMSEGLT
ncbi:hypothetical protein TGMAS_279540 [Toxoplasma gondii MAS]|uniref:Uncharacterized protein n=1 Tax=Toxoplasma gondii MAS TaxID=943118 RepID=A0A086PJS9_TOXGO|nr:hypothetical protein TGMAS_279540 [Toxoplasma gondii MAS]